MNGTIGESRKQFLAGVSLADVDCYGPRKAGILARGFRRVKMALFNPAGFLGCFQGAIEKKALCRYQLEVCRANEALKTDGASNQAKGFAAAYEKLKKDCPQFAANADLGKAAQVIELLKDKDEMLKMFGRCFGEIGEGMKNVEAVVAVLGDGKVWKHASQVVEKIMGNEVADMKSLKPFIQNAVSLVLSKEINTLEERRNALFVELVKGVEHKSPLEDIYSNFKANLIFELGFLVAMYSLLYVAGAGFWMFTIMGAIADLSIDLGLGALDGYNKGMSDDDAYVVIEMVKSMKSSWDKRVNDENSLHPLIDSMVTSFFIVFTWGWADKLKKGAQAGSAVHKLVMKDMWDYCAKYTVMNWIFSIKGMLLQGKFSGMQLIEDGVYGVIRGRVKNIGMLGHKHKVTDAHELPWTLGSWLIADVLKRGLKRLFESKDGGADVKSKDD